MFVSIKVTRIDQRKVDRDPASYFNTNTILIGRKLAEGDKDEILRASYALVKAAKSGCITRLDPKLCEFIKDRVDIGDYSYSDIDDESEYKIKAIQTNTIGAYGGALLTSEYDTENELYDAEIVESMIATLSENLDYEQAHMDSPQDGLSVEQKLCMNILFSTAVISYLSPSLVMDANSNVTKNLRKVLQDDRIESTYAGLTFANMARKDPERVNDHFKTFCSQLDESFVGDSGLINKFRGRSTDPDDRLFASMAYCYRRTLPTISDEKRIRVGKNKVDLLSSFAKSNDHDIRHRAMAMHALEPVCRLHWHKLGEDQQHEIIKRKQHCLEQSTPHPGMAAAARAIESSITVPEKQTDESIAELFSNAKDTIEKYTSKLDHIPSEEERFAEFIFNGDIVAIDGNPT